MSFNDLLGKIGNLGRNISGAISPWSTIGQVGNSIVGSFLGNSMSRKALRQQKELMNFSAGVQKDIMDYQNQQNLASWNIQNEYNTPSAQLQRIKDAGLNTNLIYGQNGLQAGNAEAIASGTGASLNSNVDAKVASGIMSRQMDLQAFQAMKQGALVDSQIDLNNANAEFSRAQANEVAPNAQATRENLQKQTAQIEEFIKQMPERFSAEINKIWADYELSREQRYSVEATTAATWANCAKLGIDYETAYYILHKKLPEEVKEIQSRTRLNGQQARFLVINGLYLSSLTMLNNQDYNWKGFLYNHPSYRIGTAFRPFWDMYKSKTEGIYNGYKARSEKFGFPYLQNGVLGSGISLGNAYVLGNSSDEGFNLFGKSSPRYGYTTQYELEHEPGGYSKPSKKIGKKKRK